MEELEAGTFNTQLVIPFVDLEMHNLDCDVCPTLEDLIVDSALELRAAILDGELNPVGVAHQFRGLDFKLMAMEII